MSWNPFKKKEADEPQAGSAATLQPADAVQAIDDDDTKPIMDAGAISERVSLIREQNGIRFEKVEVRGKGGLSDSFLRLEVLDNPDVVSWFNSEFFFGTDDQTGFRHNLISPAGRKIMAFDLPEETLASLIKLEDPSQLPSTADVLAMIDELATAIATVEDRGFLTWPEPETDEVGLVRTGDGLPAGLNCWRTKFFGWDGLVKSGDVSHHCPGNLVRLFLPLLERLAVEATKAGLEFGEFQIRRLSVRLEELASTPGLSYAALRKRLTAIKPSFTTCGLTDNGVKRQHNEDAWLAFQIDQASSTGSQFLLAVVADGMGGHASGEVASSLALDLLRQQLMMSLLAPRSQPAPTARLTEQLKSVIPSIDRALNERAHLSEAMSGMGTTLAGVAVLRQATTVTDDGSQRLGEETAAVFHVGDSRVYRYGADGLKRLTRDHSLVQDLLSSGSISAEEAFIHPRKNVIMRCLGGGDSDGTPDVNLFTPGPGEILLVASDGLSDALRDTEIAAIFRDRANDGLEQLGAALVSAANAAGGPDNITVLLVSCGL